jgi:hypothetical protein
MSKTLIVNNVPFEYPEQGEQSPWGEAATGWAEEVTNVLNSVNGPSDILETAGNIANNISTFTDIDSFFFDSNNVRSFSVRGNIARETDSNEVYEEFLLVGLYQASSWVMTQEGIGDSGVEFNITSTGQVQYKSSNLAGANYSGIIKFRGVGILNT